MSIVVLVSGGLDSTLVARLAKEEGVNVYPLFVNYGQRSMRREFQACLMSMKAMNLPEPKIADLAGFGQLIRSGLTDSSLRVLEDAFTPGRNALFLLMASSYAYQMNADAVSIGLLSEETSLFPDQTKQFLSNAESFIEVALGRKISILAPLADFNKQDVVQLAAQKGIAGTYSCHVGGEIPCGKCIACLEFLSEDT
ncbi:7-cyano-7-deazaguanine synthase [Celeribacter sp.]|uniref:7-cyano-7-deazaguanine synthase n=1 Tax=Celeribacter sp. TaxID=1890673 RepID=UPI003A9248D2